MLLALLSKSVLPRKSFTMSKNLCTIAVCQLTCTNDKKQNLSVVQSLMEEAATKKAKMVFLPEACDFIGANDREIWELSEPLNGHLIDEYKALAKKYSLWISVGGFHELIENKEQIRNSHVLINDQGVIKGVYRKAHLFDAVVPEQGINLQESKYVERGNEIVSPIETPAGLLSLSICYDIRFPELSTILRKMDATILTYPSAFTSKTGAAHWEVLLRARAIENQCYVVAAAQYGKHNEKRISHGQAMIVNPWGEIVAECPKYNANASRSNCLAVVDVDMDLIRKVRREMPVFEHRRNDLYHVSVVSYQYPDDNIVFKFAHKDIPGSTVFYRTNLSFAFTNIRCVVPGHVLVAPIRPVRRLQELTPEEISDLFQTAIKVQKVMEKVQSSSSSTICIQDGSDAGQTIPHVHCHILPRKPHDFAVNDDIYTELARHDKAASVTPMRPLDEMIKEAVMLRGHFYGAQSLNGA